MAGVPITFRGTMYPKNKTDPPYAFTAVGIANITGLSVGGGPILPPDEVPPIEPPLVIWGGPIDPYPDHGLPEPPQPPDKPPEGAPPKPHEGWNYNNGSNPDYPNTGWYFVYIPGPTDAQPHKRK